MNKILTVIKTDKNETITYSGYDLFQAIDTCQPSDDNFVVIINDDFKTYHPWYSFKYSGNYMTNEEYEYYQELERGYNQDRI